MNLCPKCNSVVIMIYGNHRDYDTEFCSNRECDYEIDFETMTCVEEDGSLTIIQTNDDNVITKVI